jgi:hypothetical protein
MVMLPDTLSTRAFMKAAKYIKQEDGKPYINLINSAYHDSGKLEDFKSIMTEFGYNGIMISSKIDDTATLLAAAELGYNSFGADSFFGDSEKVWGNKNALNNSMVVNAIRVKYDNTGGAPIAGIPYIREVGNGIVIGYPINMCKGNLSLDKNLKEDVLDSIKKYAETVNVHAKDVPIVIGTKSITEIFTLEKGMIRNGMVGGTKKVKKAKKNRKTRRNY